MRSSKIINLLVVAALLLGVVAMIQAPTAQAAEPKPKITLIIYTAATVEFFIPVVNGAKEAADMFGVDLDIQYGDSDPVKQNNLIETAVANKVNGIAVSIQDDDAFDESVANAMKAGIPVVSFNVDDSKGAAGNARMAFMGQDFVATGYLIAQRMIKDHNIGKGDLVFTPVEWPEAVYATLRYAGVKKALDEVGAKSEMIGTGANLPDVQTKEVQYLLGHPETKAIIGLGSSPLTVAPKAIEEAKMKIPLGGFDLTSGYHRRHRERDDHRHRRPAAVFPGVLLRGAARPVPEVWPLSVRHEHRRSGPRRQDERGQGKRVRRQVPITSTIRPRGTLRAHWPFGQRAGSLLTSGREEAMNLRERFLEVMQFNTGVHSIKWEFGYWGEVLDNWYEAGLPKQHYPEIPVGHNPTSGLYHVAWKSVKGGRLPKGIAVMGGGLYWPTQSFPIDHDVRAYFGMDTPLRLVDVNQIFYPSSRSKVLEEDEKQMVYVDLDGVKRRFLKATATMPSGEGYPIRDRATWQKLKEERSGMDNSRPLPAQLGRADATNTATAIIPWR